MLFIINYICSLELQKKEKKKPRKTTKKSFAPGVFEFIITFVNSSEFWYNASTHQSAN